MAKEVILCASTLEPHHLLGERGFGIALGGGGGRPNWWPSQGESIHVHVKNSKLLLGRTREALSVMKDMLIRQGSECILELEK